MAVGEVIRRATGALDRHVGTLWVEGETAQVARPMSGHVYFQLKDRAAVIPAVMWRSDVARMKFRLDPGMRVVVRGKLGIYERDGKFQLYVDVIEPAGLGAAALALQQLKDELAAEGLFAEARKRPLPHLPRRIGVVTSATGAAVRDIIRAVQRRFPTPILVCDAAVQGPDAPRQMIYALRALARTDVDVIILGRGGGSATDLAAFNDGRLVREIAACPVPVISAVGHEVDLTLCDLVADRRASTPTMAAEMAVPVLADLEAELRVDERRLRREMERVLRDARQHVDTMDAAARARIDRLRARSAGDLAALERRLGNVHPRARLAAQRAVLGGLERRLAAKALGRRLADARAALGRADARLAAATTRRLSSARACLGELAGRLEAMSPLRVLDRGYAVATRDGHVVTDSDAVQPGDAVEVRLARGRLRTRVTDVE